MSDKKELMTLEEMIAEANKDVVIPESDRDVWIKVKNRQFILPNGEKNDEMTAAIMAFIYRNDFFDGPYNPKKTAPPVCWSQGADKDHMVPDSSSTNRQAEQCNEGKTELCPMSVWGTGPGGNGRACRQKRILALMAPGAKEFLLIRIPPSGISDLDKVLKAQSSEKDSTVNHLTHFSFDPRADYDKIVSVDAGPNNNIREMFPHLQAAKDLIKEQAEATRRFSNEINAESAA